MRDTHTSSKVASTKRSTKHALPAGSSSSGSATFAPTVAAQEAATASNAIASSYYVHDYNKHESNGSFDRARINDLCKVLVECGKARESSEAGAAMGAVDTSSAISRYGLGFGAKQGTRRKYVKEERIVIQEVVSEFGRACNFDRESEKRAIEMVRSLPGYEKLKVEFFDGWKRKRGSEDDTTQGSRFLTSRKFRMMLARNDGSYIGAVDAAIARMAAGKAPKKQMISSERHVYSKEEKTRIAQIYADELARAQGNVKDAVVLKACRELVGCEKVNMASIRRFHDRYVNNQLDVKRHTGRRVNHEFEELVMQETLLMLLLEERTPEGFQKAAIENMQYSLIAKCGGRVRDRLYPDAQGNLVPRFKLDPSVRGIKFSSTWVNRVMERRDRKVVSAAARAALSEDAVCGIIEGLQRKIDEMGINAERVFNEREILVDWTDKDFYNDPARTPSELTGRFIAFVGSNGAGTMLPTHVSMQVRCTDPHDLSQARRALRKLAQDDGPCTGDDWMEGFYERLHPANETGEMVVWRRPFLYHPATLSLITVHNTDWTDSFGYRMRAELLLKQVRTRLTRSDETFMMVTEELPYHSSEYVCSALGEAGWVVNFTAPHMANKLQPAEMVVNLAYKYLLRARFIKLMSRCLQDYKHEVVLAMYHGRPLPPLTLAKPRIEDGVREMLQIHNILESNRYDVCMRRRKDFLTSLRHCFRVCGLVRSRAGASVKARNVPAWQDSKELLERIRPTRQTSHNADFSVASSMLGISSRSAGIMARDIAQAQAQAGEAADVVDDLDEDSSDGDDDNGEVDD